MAFKKEKQNMQKTLIGLKGFTDRRKKKSGNNQVYFMIHCLYHK